MLARPFAPLLGATAALLVLANLAAILGLALTFAWARELVGARSAFAAVLLLACYPPSMFLSSAYAEAPMLCAIAAALLLASQRRHWAAAAVAGVGSALRPTGLILSLLVFIWGARSILAQRSRNRYLLVASAGVVSVFGAIGYQIYLTERYGRADAYFVAQRTWETQPTKVDEPPSPGESATHAEPSGLGRLASTGAWSKLLMLGVLGTACFGAVRPGKIPREAFLLPIGIFLLGFLPGWGARATSIARFETAAIPCFVLLGSLLSKRTALLYMIALLGLVGECLLCFQFSRGLWAG